MSCSSFSFIETEGIIIAAYLIIKQLLFSSLPEIGHEKTKIFLVCFSFVVIYCKALVTSLNFGGFLITYSEWVKNIWVIFYRSLSFKDISNLQASQRYFFTTLVILAFFYFFRAIFKMVSYACYFSTWLLPSLFASIPASTLGPLHYVSNLFYSFFILLY